MTGLDRWNRLPADVRQVLEETGKEMEDYVYAEAERLDQRLLEQLRGSGIEINEPAHDSFFEASRLIYEEFGRSVPGGGEMIETAIRLVDPRE